MEKVLHSEYNICLKKSTWRMNEIWEKQNLHEKRCAWLLTTCYPFPTHEITKIVCCSKTKGRQSLLFEIHITVATNCTGFMCKQVRFFVVVISFPDSVFVYSLSPFRSLSFTMRWYFSITSILISSRWIFYFNIFMWLRKNDRVILCFNL
jgi:hypothetical protein